MTETTIARMVDEQMAAQADRPSHERRARWAVEADIMCAEYGHPGYHDGRCDRCARHEPVAVRAAADPRREILGARIEALNDAIERDHIATEGANASQLRSERRALYAELDALPREPRTISEPAGEVRSLAD